MNNIPKGLRNAALIATAVLGRFGSTKDNAPEAFDAGEHIEGSGPGKARDRHAFKFRAQKFRSAVSEVFKLRAEKARASAFKVAFVMQNQKPACVVGSMRESNWIRENRVRRACGLPQLRAVA